MSFGLPLLGHFQVCWKILRSTDSLALDARSLHLRCCRPSFPLVVRATRVMTSVLRPFLQGVQLLPGHWDTFLQSAHISALSIHKLVNFFLRLLTYCIYQG